MDHAPQRLQRPLRRRFLNVRTGERILLDIPDIHRCFVLGTTAEVVLLVCRTDTYVVQLLNALTVQAADLPHATTLWGSSRSLDSRARDIDLRGAGLVDGSTVALHFDDFSLAIAKPGDRCWKRLRFQDKIISALPFAGRIYCATSKNISVVTRRDRANRPTKLVAVAAHELDTSIYLQSRMYLVENDGELILCYHTSSAYERYIPGKCMAYRVKLGTRSMVEPLARLGGQALFAGTSCCLLVPAGVSPSVNADTVYVCAGGPRALALDLLGGSGSVEPRVFDREETAYYLSRYVCRP